MRTASLRRQHDAAMALISEIVAATAKLSASPGREQIIPISTALAKLTGLLKIHFAQEDQSLYPSMLRSGQADVAEVARRFIDEMGQIGPIYASFVESWSSNDAIAGDPAGFRAASHTVFSALANRIERENSVLYALADTLGGSASSPR